MNQVYLPEQKKVKYILFLVAKQQKLSSNLPKLKLIIGLTQKISASSFMGTKNILELKVTPSPF